jgi:hypothetical protein
MWQQITAGLLATLTMDVLSVAATRLRISAPLQPNLIGRWFASVARAQPFHTDIALTAPVTHELAIALPVHYAIGIALTLFYLFVTGRAGWPTDSLRLALAFAMCTNVLPWFVMFPSMGYGFFGANGPQGTHLFVSSVINHLSFGVGIWIALRVLNVT